MPDKASPWPDPVFDPGSTAGRIFETALQQACAIVTAADDLPDLRQAAERIRTLVHDLVDQAQAAEPMTLLISALNDVLTRRVIEVVSAGTALGGIRWCWIAFGSEGRQEQTLSSDQDNGIIFDSDLPADAVRAMLLPLAQRINAALDDCGFPLCTGLVMASNPQCCLSLREWKERFRHWIIEGDPQALLNASIFFDLRPLHGAWDLAEELSVWLAQEASANRRFLFQMAANSLQREAPLGVFRRFVVDRRGRYPGTVDLKVNAATLFIDAARVYGLSGGVRACNTAERFRLAATARRLHPDDTEKWIEALYFIQLLRLKYQQRSYRHAREMHNHVDPFQLDRTEQDKLLDALRQARALQNRLALDYPGSQSVY